jgi:hypothetical protein
MTRASTPVIQVARSLVSSHTVIFMLPPRVEVRRAVGGLIADAVSWARQPPPNLEVGHRLRESFFRIDETGADFGLASGS